MYLQSLQLKNFKCFRELDMELGKITLLTGANSSGKSSVIYSLLAVMQTESFPYHLSLNGEYRNMGGFEDIVFQHNLNNEIDVNCKIIYPFEGVYSKYEKIESCWQNNSVNYLPQFKRIGLDIGDIRLSERSYTVINRIDQNNASWSVQEWNKQEKAKELKEERINLLDLKEADIVLTFFKKNYFNFIHSFRVEPQRYYYRLAKSKPKIEPTGEGYPNQIIEWQEREPEKFKALIESMKSLGLLHDIQARQQSGGLFEFKVKTHPNSVFNALADVGFGVSKVLPILVADLQLPDSSLLAVSEPEIDLHPPIQANFANYFLDQINTRNKRYMIETHSEYLLNRFRLLIAKGELKEEDVKVYFFQNDGMETNTFPIQFKPNGQIVGAPRDFFTTYAMDVMDIALNAQ